jgi:hypothetical protein
VAPLIRAAKLQAGGAAPFGGSLMPLPVAGPLSVTVTIAPLST